MNSTLREQESASAPPSAIADTTQPPQPQPQTASKPKFAEWLGLETLGDAELLKLVRACHEWATAFARGGEPRWLTLLGPSGVGKTHCAGRLWKRAAQLSDWTRCQYVHREIYWPGLVQRLRAGEAFGERSDMARWPVLFLDDVGAERDTSGFATEELCVLLGQRERRWTLITSNLDLREFQKLDARIADRLVRGKNICVAVRTKSYAARKA